MAKLAGSVSGFGQVPNWQADGSGFDTMWVLGARIISFGRRFSSYPVGAGQPATVVPAGDSQGARVWGWNGDEAMPGFALLERLETVALRNELHRPIR